MHRALLGLIAGTSIAAASPLEPLWRQPYRGSCTAPVIELGDGLAILQGKQLIAVDRATGRLSAARTLAAGEPNEQPGGTWDRAGASAFAIGGVLALVGGHWVGGYDLKSGAELWKSVPAGGGIPWMEADAARLIMGVPAHLGAGDPGVLLAQLDPRTGKPVWQIELPRGQQLHDLVLAGPRIYVELEHGALPIAVSVLAVDAATGKVVWTRAITSHHDGAGDAPSFPLIATGDAVVVGVEREDVRVLDAATGKERAIAAVGTAFAAGDGAVYALGPDAVSAWSLAGKPLWTQPAHGGDVALVAGALHVHDHERLHALDPASGAELASYDLAGFERMYLGRSPQLIACGNGLLVALDPSGKVVPPERATLAGTATAKGLPKGIAPPRSVTVADRVGQVSKGAYSIEVTGRGWVHLRVSLPDTTFLTESDGYSYTGCEKIVELTGAKKYRASCVGRAVSNYP